MWGMLADRFGRRPVLLVGLAGSAAASILMGLADSYPAALAARLLDGFFCGNECVANTYLGELVDSENEARAFGILGVVFSFGLFLGPVLGGGLARPASWEPQIFAGTLFERHPFLLANLIFACLVIAVFLLGFAALKETRGHEQASGLLNDEARDFRRRQVLLPQGRRLWQLLIASCLLCGYIAARLNSLILVSSLPTTLHGLGISSHEFACVQACAAFMLALNQTTCYGCLVRKVGNHAGYALGLLWTIAITLPMPFYYMATDDSPSQALRLLPIAGWQATSQLGFGIAFPLCTVLVNKECTARNRAVVNGWCGSLNALARGLGPELAGALVHLGCSMETQDVRLGRYLPFYANLVPAIVSAVLVFRQRPASRDLDGEAACELGTQL